MSAQEFCCPQCHSDNIQSYEIIYNQNVSNSSQTTTGVGVTLGGNVGGGVATTNGVSVTELGKSVSPPTMQSYSGVKSGCLIYLAGAMISSFASYILSKLSETLASYSGVIIFIATIYAIYHYNKKKKQEVEQWNQEVYPRLLDEWRHSYMCMKCGNRFTIR